MKLLSRDEFRESVYQRDKHTCVSCGTSNVKLDAHHIIDRKLFTKPHELNGYFIDNGASLCSECHIKAEQTLLSCDEIREAAKINIVVLPDDFYDNEKYDKWGNILLSNGQRMKGHLFYDENVQKVLKEANLLNIFTDYIKHARTYHLSFSEGSTSDDKVLKDQSHFEGKEVVGLIKMDGECTSLYTKYLHARSIDSGSHISRDWVKQFHASISYNIPENYRILGENMYAKHSIHYTNLLSYFYGWQVWRDNICLSYDDTLEWFELLGIQPVKEIYRGIYDEKKIKDLVNTLDTTQDEGFVIRLADSFTYSDYSKCVAKFVRKNHIADSESDKHWRLQKIIPNGIIK